MFHKNYYNFTNNWEKKKLKWFSFVTTVSLNYEVCTFLKLFKTYILNFQLKTTRNFIVCIKNIFKY